MSTLRTGKAPFNVTSLRRNQGLRDLLIWLADNPNKTILDIAVHTDWSQPKSRNAVETLRQANLIYVSDTDQSGFHTPINFYSVKPHADFELNLHLPIVRPSHLPAPGAHKSKAQSKPAGAALMRRDPMVELLMGSGRAPSLNFIDSLKGVHDVKPQTAGPSH